MNITDPIADFLTRVRNAQLAKKASVTLPTSRLKFQLAKILEAEGYVAAVSEDRASSRPSMTVTLKYVDGRPAIRVVRRVSTPGRRLYASAKDLPRVFSDIGIAIISTSSGLMTNKEARKRSLGGEVMCEVF
jgi:small subunit ribosomal protein S8